MSTMPGESNISKNFTERTTKFVIVLILSTLFLLPFLELSTYYSEPNSYNKGLTQLVDLYKESLIAGSGITDADYQKAYDHYFDFHHD